MFWESAFRDTNLVLFCSTGAGHSCSAAGPSANWKSTVGSGDSSVDLIACNNLTNSELMLNRLCKKYFQI